METYKAVFHIDKLENWSALLNNISNLLKSFSKENESIEVIVVANANAVSYYTSSTHTETEIKKLKELAKEEVQFTACHNSLNSQDIDTEDLYSFVKVVPAGVSELVKKQAEGFSYIKV